MAVFRLRRRARAQLLMGVDSWPFALLAAWTARRGLALEGASPAPDAGMERRLRRIFVLALVFAGLGLAFTLVRLWLF